MQILNNQYPPNIAEIRKKLEIDNNTLFAYGDELFNPSGKTISDDLIVHETMHEIQQRELGIEAWWDRYLTDNAFRLTQEVEAYRQQYRFVKANFNRQVARASLQKMAKALSSRLYGSVINKANAQEIICQND